MIRNLNSKEISFILNNNYVGSLGYIYNNRPFILPITYFYNEEQNNIICYSNDGHKTNALRKMSAVALSVTDIESVNHWNSVLIHGTYKERSGSDAKAILHQFSLGVKEIILNKEHKDLDFISQFSSKIYEDEMPIVFTIEIEEITAKRRQSK